MPTYKFNGVAHAPADCYVTADSPEEAEQKLSRGEWDRIETYDDPSDFTWNQGEIEEETPHSAGP
jgi:hypothetical protein